MFVANRGDVEGDRCSEPSSARSAHEVSAIRAVFVAADTAGDGAGDLAGATCGGGSFSPDTQVVMADGSTKPLGQVKVGDKVEATNTATGKSTVQTVTTVWVNHDTDLMNVTVRFGGTTSVIHATQNHLFWDPAKNAWVEADQLKAGEALRTDEGAIATVAGTVIVAGAADMWDLTVTNDHDFYVVTTTANVLVHDCSWNAGTELPSGEKAGQVGNRIWGHGTPDPSRLDGLSNTQLRGIASRADAVQLQQWYEGAVAAGDGGATAPIRVQLAQKIIDAWDAG